jgi:hypothetical protein
MTIYYFVACNVCDHCHFIERACIVELQQCLKQIITLREIFASKVIFTP